MKEIKFVATCLASYTSTIYAPDDINEDNALQYILEHFDEGAIENLEFLEDFVPEEYLVNDDIVSITEVD